MQIPSTWLRTVKPRGYFERRKSPAGDSGEIQIKPDYQHVLYSNAGVETARKEVPVYHPTPWPIKLIIVTILLGLLAIFAWLYFIG